MMRTTSPPVMLVSCCLIAGCAVDGRGAKPDFSGTWVLDLSASALESPPPDSSIFIIDHDEPTLLAQRTHVVDEEANTVESRFTTDSVVRAVRIGGLEIPTRVYWDGDVLVLDQAWSQGRVRVTNVVRYTLGMDGQTMVADESMRAGSNQHHNIWMFRRR